MQSILNVQKNKTMSWNNSVYQFPKEKTRWEPLFEEARSAPQINDNPAVGLQSCSSAWFHPWTATNDMMQGKESASKVPLGSLKCRPQRYPRVTWTRRQNLTSESESLKETLLQGRGQTQILNFVTSLQANDEPVLAFKPQCYLLQNNNASRNE